MLKSILKLQGAQVLTVDQQKNINGGSDSIPGGCDTVQVISLSEADCLNYDPKYRPVYVGQRKCSITIYCP